ncbi:TerD family protein [Streptomyces sp. NPDC002454]|uniref:TerD family protein n=1 Tax=Streptomyces sp. NPDC002490 TaxID=3154416 RepID=UPI0033171A98
MTAELVRGENRPLTRTRLEIRITTDGSVIAGAVLGDDGSGASGPARVVHPGAPALPGLEVVPGTAAGHRLALDLSALPEGTDRVQVFLALPAAGGGPTGFGALPAPFAAVGEPHGTEVASYTVIGLDTESAVVVLELYRRGGVWKVRAVGQGYAGGLAELLADHGVPDAVERAGAVAATTVPAPGPVDYTHRGRSPAAGSPPAPVAGDATGWSWEERLYNQVSGMFEDLARSVAAYRSAVDFAESRRDQELDRALADPRGRLDAGDGARRAARDRYVALVERAKAALDRDLAQLRDESAVVEPALPAAFARWDNAVWQSAPLPAEAPMALRLGDLRLPEADRLRVPMLVRLPLERGLWVDSGRTSVVAATVDEDTHRRLALASAVAHVVRIVAVHPPGEFAVHAIDAAGAGANGLAPLLDGGALASPPARGAAGAAEVLARLTRRVDLVQMALRGEAVDALPSDLDTARQLLIVHDFPHGFDDRAVTQLRYLADEGPGVGVHLLMVADREDAAAFGPLLDPLWRSLLRLTPVPDDHLVDPWVGHAWTYEPSLPPSGGEVLHRVLARVAAARRDRGR